MRIVGVIGGMGPQATVDLYQSIIEVTPASMDQEHIRIIIYSYPQIPDRTKAILGMGPSPVPAMVEAGISLIRAGAQMIAIPCNTAHYFLSSLKAELDVPVINMIEEVARFIKGEHVSWDVVGLLATDGTLISQVYHRVLEDFGIKVIAPIEVYQKKVMDTIYGEYGVKAGHTSKEQSETLKEVMEALRERGAKGIIAGCTEIPHIFTRFPVDIDMGIVSSTQVLAEAIVRESMGQTNYETLHVMS